MTAGPSKGLKSLFIYEVTVKRVNRFLLSEGKNATSFAKLMRFRMRIKNDLKKKIEKDGS